MTDSRSLEPADALPSDELAPPTGWQAPLLDFVLSLVRHRLLLASVAAVGGLVGVQKLANTPPYYKASATLLLLPTEEAAVETSFAPPGQGEQLSRRAESAESSLPAKTSVYATLLTSRSVLLQVAESFHEPLIASGDIRDGSTLNDVATFLRTRIAVRANDDGMITLDVTAQHAHLCADLANHLVAIGEETSRTIERAVLERHATARDLAAAEARRLFEGSMAANVTSAAEAPSEPAPTDVGSNVPWNAEVLTQTQEFRRTLHAVLSAEADLFRTRADRATGHLAVLQAATPPAAASGPSTTHTMAVSLGGFLLVGIALCIAMEQWKATRGNPYLAERIQEIRRTVFHIPVPMRTRTASTDDTEAYERDDLPTELSDDSPVVQAQRRYRASLAQAGPSPS